MFKIATWNVAGLYAAIKKEFCKTVKTLDCDVLCLQETKLSLKKPPPAEIAEQLKSWKYRTYANSEAKAGYSGTAILSKTKVKTRVSKFILISQHLATKCRTWNRKNKTRRLWSILHC
jgi:exodeoxyribonuclease III